jgi:uncharacterized protein YaiL (DUF2058 family)
VSSSLRDQLLQAGLVTEKQVRQASQQQGRQPRNKAAPPAEQKVAAQQAQAAKAGRDQELNRRQQEKAEKKARMAQIKQLIEQNRLPKIESDERYNFIDGRKIRYVAADAPLRDRINRGELAIVRYEGHFELVPADTAARVRERDERAVITLTVAQESTNNDDPYKDHVVPDDLIW